MAKYAVALDQGTTSSRAMVFDHSGRVVAVSQKEHEQIYPKPGWVEHDPKEIWARCSEVLDEAMEKAGATRDDIAALGITNQRETALVWDRTPASRCTTRSSGRTRGPTRSSTSCGQDGGQDRFRAKVGLPLATYFSGPKVRWILDNVDGARAKAEAGDLVFGNIDTWCIWNLTGGVNGGLHITDVTNASRTMLMDLETLQWDKSIADTIGVPLSMLPEIKASSEVYGEVKVGNLQGISIAGDLGDQQAATFGQACFEPGDAKNTYGTGNFMLLNTANEAVQSKSGLLTTVCFKIGDQKAVYALEGSIAITGALVQWLRDNLKMIQAAPQVEELAKSVEDNGGAVHRAGVLGPVRAVLALRRARRIRRPDPVRHRRAHRPRHARGDRLPDARGDGRDGNGFRRRSEGTQGRRWHGRQRHAHAVPGRHPRRAGHPAGRR